MAHSQTKRPCNLLSERGVEEMNSKPSGLMVWRKRLKSLGKKRD